MPKPFFHRDDEIWDDDEERERGQHRFPSILLDDFVRLEENDHRRRYGLRIIQERPLLLQGAGRGPLELFERGEELYTPLFSIMLVPPNNNDPNEELDFMLGDPLDPNRGIILGRHAYNIVEVLNDRIRRMERVIIDEQETVGAIQRLRDTLSAQNSYNWILLIVIIATMRPHPDDQHMILRSYPGRLSVNRAVSMLIGPRGLLHGWSGDMPNLINAFQRYGNFSRFFWSHEYSIDSETDGDSSFDSDSVGYGTSSFKSGPRGVARGRPPVTGVSSVSEGSSLITNNGEFIQQVETASNVDDMDGSFRLKRFKDYMKRSAIERRERRAMRRARRETRNHYDWQRRLEDPAYDMEARRAEVLAAESCLNESRAQESLNAQRKTERILQWCRAQQDIVSGMHGLLSPNDELADYRLKDLRHSLCEQISRTWSQFYGDQMAAETTPEEREKLEFHCWMTPVRWIRQTGPNCGLAVLAMAARPILTCEAAMDTARNYGDNYNELEDVDELNEVVKKAILEYTEKERRKAGHSTDSTINPAPDIDVPNLADIQKEAIRSGYSSRGEMFSTLAMVDLAKMHQTGRYNVTLVKRDLLDMTDEVNEEDVGTEIKRSEVENRCISPTDLNIDGEINELDQNVAPRTMSSENVNLQPLELTVVQRLMRGHLIAVCFDCDRNMMPSLTNGGSSAHWALLCGVILGKRHKRQDKKIQEHDDELPDSDFLKYGYLYTYDPNKTEFTPNGYVDRRVQDMETSFGRITTQFNSYWESINVDDAGMAEEDNDDPKQNFTEDSNSYDISDQDLKRDADRVWVIARHGKIGSRYAVWSLKELAQSNCQLRTPSDMILRSIPSEIKMQWDNKQQPIDCNTANLLLEKTESILIDNNHDSKTYCNLDPAETDYKFQSSEKPIGELPVKPLLEENIMVIKNPVLEQIHVKELSPPPSTQLISLPQTAQLSPAPLTTSPSLEPPPAPTQLPPSPVSTSPSTQPSPPPPPPPPIQLIPPPPPPPPQINMCDDYNEPPFVLPEGPRLDKCLAHQYISFEPVRVPTIVSEEVNQQTLNPLSTLQCQFSFKMNLGLKLLDLTKNTIDHWSRQRRRQPSMSSSESSTSPDRQITQSTEHCPVNNIENPEEHSVQSKPVKQTIQSQMDIKWPLELKEQQPQIFSESIHPEQIEYLSRDSQSKLPPSKLSKAMRLVIRRRLQLDQTEEDVNL